MPPLRRRRLLVLGLEIMVSLPMVSCAAAAAAPRATPPSGTVAPRSAAAGPPTATTAPPTSTQPPSATPIPATPAPTQTPPPATATPLPPPTAAPTPFNLYIGNTGGDGVYLRATPDLNDKVSVWPDGTLVTVLNSLTTGGIHWLNVRVPDGKVGWLPSDYLVANKPTPAPVAAAPVQAKPRFSRDQFRSLVMGEDPDGVIAAVGRPDGTESVSNGRIQYWYYSHRTYDPISGRVDSVAMLTINSARGVVLVDFAF